MSNKLVSLKRKRIANHKSLKAQIKMSNKLATVLVILLAIVRAEKIQGNNTIKFLITVVHCLRMNHTSGNLGSTEV